MIKKILLLIALLTVWHTAIAQDSDRFFQQGMKAYESENYGSAELLFRKALRSGKDRSSDNASYYLALSVYHQKKYRAAIFEFNNYLNSCRVARLCTMSRFWIGESWYHLDEKIKAIEEYKRFIDTSESDSYKAGAHDRIAELYMSQKRYDEAILELQQATSLCNDRNKNSERILKTGIILHLQGKNDEALQKLLPLLTSTVDSRIAARARLATGQIYQEQNRHRHALSIFNAIPNSLEKESPFSDVQYLRAVSYIELSNTTSAKSSLELFLVTGQNSRWYHHAILLYGELLLQEGDTEKATRLLEQVINESNTISLKVKSARILAAYYSRKDPAQAIPYLEKALEYDIVTDTRELKLLLAQAYIENHDYDKARKLLETFMEENPFDTEMDQVQFLLARIMLRKGDNARAKELLEAIQKDNPFSRYITESYYYLALASYRQKKYDESIGLLKRYINAGGKDNRYEAEITMLQCYLALANVAGTYQKSALLVTRYSREPGVEEHLLNAALFLDEKNHWYYNQLSRGIFSHYPESASASKLRLHRADSYFDSKDYSSAASEYSLYLNSVKPARPRYARWRQLESLYNSGNHEEFIVAVSRLQSDELESSRWDGITRMLIHSYNETGNVEKLYNMYPLVPFDSLDVEEKEMLFKASLKMDDTARAAMLLESIPSSSPQWYTMLLELVDAHLEKSDFNKSEEFIQTGLGQNPEEPYRSELHYRYALMLFKSGENDRAIAELEQIHSDTGKTAKEAIALKILLLHEKNDTDKAIELTTSHRAALAETARGKEMLLRAMTYYYQKKDLEHFLVFSKMLSQITTNTVPVEYQSARLFYSRDNFDRAFYHYYRLSQIEGNDHESETMYYLGLIRLLYNKNYRQGMYYFAKALEYDNNYYSELAALELARIHITYTGNREEAKKLLLSLSESHVATEASNLLLHYFREQ